MLKVGLIGCGFMGTMHYNCYQNIEGVEVVALADIRSEKAEQLANGKKLEIYGDGYELLANADVDVVDICLPTYLHTQYALKAMEKVKYLFVEKPVTLTADEGELLLAKAKETGCQVQVGQVIRFWDEYVALTDIVNKNIYGNIVNAVFRRISPIPTWGWQDWLLNKELSGGAAQDLHIHDTDFVLSLFGKPESFYSVKNVIGEANSYINTFMKYKTFPVNVEGTWGLPTTHPFEASFRVVFEKAVVEMAGGKLMLYTADAAEEIKIEKQVVEGQAFEGGNVSDLGGYYNELLYFCNQAKNGAPVEKATLQVGVESVKFVLQEVAHA